MRRLSKRRREHSSGSTRHGVNGASLPNGWPTTSTATWVSLADNRTLAGGAVVRTSLVARLLGLRLLTVEGTVLVTPASFGVPTDRPARRTSSLLEVTTTTALRPKARNPAVGKQDSGIGSRLDASAQLLDESVEDLQALD
jgi:hypothetical protein